MGLGGGVQGFGGFVCYGFRVLGPRFWVLGLRFRVQGLAFRGFRGLGVEGLGSRRYGILLRV